MKQFLGAIYDFDDTILNNYPSDLAPYNLHELSRAEATRELGKELGIHEVVDVTYDQHLQAFIDAPEHSMEGATWQLLCMLGLEKGPINREHPLVCGVRARKSIHYKKLYEQYCEPVKGAVDYIQAFHQLGRPQGIASGAHHLDIATFIAKFNLHEHLPKERVVAWGDYDHTKPHPESFDRAFLALGLPDEPHIRAQVVAFEDDPKGVESAKRAGLHVCAVMTRFDEEVFMKAAYQPDIVVADFEVLLNT